MARKKLELVPDENKPVVPKEMEAEVVKLTKEYTNQVKSVGKKYGMILNVKISIDKSINT